MSAVIQKLGIGISTHEAATQHAGARRSWSMIRQRRIRDALTRLSSQRTWMGGYAARVPLSRLASIVRYKASIAATCRFRLGGLDQKDR